MNDYRKQLSVRLLEDLHSGSGTRSMLYDSVMARDYSGRPYIDREHLRGVMRDNALRLLKLNKISEEQFSFLFGRPGGESSKLIFSSLRIPIGDPVLTNSWTASARQLNSRTPAPQTLRTVEYLGASTNLNGCIEILDGSNEMLTALNAIVKFTTRLGGQRTRGFGSIHINNANATKIKESNWEYTISDDCSGLRLLLSNPEDLCFPVAGYAGNVIRTHNHLPGRVVRAALLAFVERREGADAASRLFSEKFRFTNAYPLPDFIARQVNEENINSISSIPLPLNWQREKYPDDEIDDESIHLPDWAKPRQTMRLVNKLTDATAQIATSRIKEGAYWVTDPDGVDYLFHQPLTIRMRNTRGEPVPEGRVKKQKTELFSEQRIPANSWFVVDILATAKDLDWLRSTAGAWLCGNRSVLMGRGKAPVNVAQAAGVREVRRDQNAQTATNSATVTLSSQLIARDALLNTCQELNVSSWLRLIQQDPEHWQQTDLYLVGSPYQATAKVGGFNYATKLPLRPVNAVAAGSVYRFAGNRLNDFLTELSQREALGERITEGFGRFIVSRSQAKERVDVGIAHAGLDAAELVNTEEEVLQLASKYCHDLQRRQAPKPSTQQWHQLIQAISIDQNQSDALNSRSVNFHFLDTIGRKISHNVKSAINWRVVFESDGLNLSNILRQPPIDGRAVWALLFLKAVVEMSRQARREA